MTQFDACEQAYKKGYADAKNKYRKLSFADRCKIFVLRRVATRKIKRGDISGYNQAIYLLRELV